MKWMWIYHRYSGTVNCDQGFLCVLRFAHKAPWIKLDELDTPRCSTIFNYRLSYDFLLSFSGISLFIIWRLICPGKKNILHGYCYLEKTRRRWISSGFFWFAGYKRSRSGWNLAQSDYVAATAESVDADANGCCSLIPRSVRSCSKGSSGRLSRSLRSS